MSQPGHQRGYESEAPGDLQALLDPLPAGEFLDRQYGQTFVHVRGTRGKFASLLPWTALNDILEQHRLEPPRVRLTREGKPVPQDRYVSFSANRRRPGSPIPRLNAASLTDELREGATLVLDNVDELYRPVRRLAESLERVFRVRVQTNCYAGWRTSHGFDLHWDDHDVFVLQVAGRKRWRVYGMTRPWPLGRDSEPAVDPPSDAVWEGLLDDGDMLYIPRGWWHVATPLDEPTLHLTVGVNNPTGIDFLSWFADRMRDCEAARQDLPHLRGPQAMRARAEALRQAVLDAWRPEILDEYMAHLDRAARPRPSFALPWSAVPDTAPPEGYRARWAPARASAVRDIGGGEIAVEASGRRWKFRAGARPVLEALLSGREYTQGEIESIQGEMLSPHAIRLLMSELARSGLVEIR